MKKILVLVVVLAMLAFASTSAKAIDVWVTVNPATVTWDAVTTLADSSPLPAGNTVKYDVFIKPDGSTVPMMKITTSPIMTLSYSVPFITEGKWDFGVQALRYDSSGNFLAPSAISWSDNPAACLGGSTFAENFYRPLSPVGNLRPQ